MRHERNLTTDRTRFRKPAIRGDHLSNVTRQPNLTESDHVFGDRDVVERRQDGQGHGEIAGRLGSLDASYRRNVDITLEERDIGVFMKHREELRQARGVDADARAARHRRRPLTDETLDLAREGAGTVHAGGKDRARLVPASIREQVGARVSDRHEPLVAHLEEPDLLSGAEAVLEGAQNAYTSGAIAFELKHNVNEVLEDARPGNGALLRYVSDEKYCDALVSSGPSESRAALANLGDRAGRRRDLGVEDRLDRVDYDYRGRGRVQGAEDRAELGMLKCADVGGDRTQALGPRADLSRRLLAADDEHTLLGPQREGRLQHQSRLPDAGLAGEQNYAPPNHTAAQHTVELFDARGDPDAALAVVGGQQRNLHVPDPAFDALGGLLDYAPPLLALRAPAHPPRHLGAAGLARGLDLRLHRDSTVGERADSPTVWETVPASSRKRPMSKRTLIVLLAVGVLAGACGQEGNITPGLAGSGSERPSPSASAGATATPTPTAAGATTAPGATAAPTSQPGGGPPAPATKPVSEGGVNPPKDGRYTYTYQGESTDPFNPGAPPEKFSGELYSDISHQGNVYTEESTNTETPGRFTTRTRWESSRILLLSFKTETAGGDFSCTFEPPLTIANIPIKPETIPTQTFKGRGNACDGKLDITVEQKENTTDANNKTWSAWRVKVRIEAGNEQFNTITDERQWLAPELGVEVRTDGTTHGEIRTPTGSQTFDGKATSALKSHP